MSVKKLFGKRLKYIRKQKGLTQQALAELCDLQTNTIGMYEIGKNAPSFKSIDKIAKILEIDLVEFFDFSDEYDMSKSEERLISDLYKEVKNLDTKMLKHIIEYIKLLKKNYSDKA